ncbi:MAG: SPOR domain-containing protein, partial [Methyloligellaceae bacterium]
AAQGSPPPQPEPEQTGGRVGRFLGNLWQKSTGGGEDEKQTAAASPAAPPALSSHWSQTTIVSRSASSPPQARAPRPAASATPAPPAPAATGGSGYRIQIAALRSDAEAQATWQRLVKKHRKLLAGHQPNLVRTELGGLGAFYRVQLGPFAEKGPSQQLCNEFKRGGLDCFLLAP